GWLRTGGAPAWTSLALTCLGMLLLAAALVDPRWQRRRPRPGENTVAVLVDDSRSLSVHDAGEERSRFEKIRESLTAESIPWLERVAEDFDVRRFVFDARLRSVSDFGGLSGEGTQSALLAALAGLKDRLADRPVAGVVVFTDGVATDADLAGFDPAGLPPLHFVPLGSGAGLTDLAIRQLTVATTAFEDAPATITAEVEAVGLAGDKVTAELCDEQGRVLEAQALPLAAGGRPPAFRFQFKPAQPGCSFHQVRVAAPGGGAARAEATDLNNRRWVAVDRGAGPYRILYVGGRPNWNYKFLERSLAEDDQVQLTALLRIATREAKFDFRGRAGESSNPLFRGFDRVGEETERHDQPVIVRLGTATPEEFRDGFPKTAAELFPFHAVILGDVEAAFFTPEQHELLERFVAERGGGLVMLGGQESFADGGYGRTPVGRMLPVSLEDSERPRGVDAAAAAVRFDLTREGLLQPWARLRTTEPDEATRIREMPSFTTLNRQASVKPGAAVIAEAVVDGRRWPAIVTQRFGRGRTLAVTIGDLWRLQLERTDAQRDRDELGKTWRQMIRALIADVPGRLDVQVRPKSAGDPTLQEIEVRAWNAEFEPLDQAAVEVTVTRPDGTSFTQTLEPSLAEPGLSTATLVVRQSGPWRVAARAGQGSDAIAGQAGWVADLDAGEFRQVAPDLALLERLAAQTKGSIVPEAELGRWAARLPLAPAPVSEPVSDPLWHQPWYLLAIVACFAGDWGLRRWKGMP
ncbi:MAG: glutamine amidotransferase, partial [Pirellulales bacterium]